MDRLEKKKILVVEDDRSLQSAVVEMLNQEGYETVSAFDGEEGLAKLSQEKPDLVLLDIILPKKDGFEFLSQMKSNSETKEIPVLILTNLEEVDKVQKAVALGATAFMIKSDYSIKEILEKVKEVLK